MRIESESASSSWGWVRVYKEGEVLHHQERYSDSVNLYLYTLDTGWKQNKLVEMCSGVLSQVGGVLWSVIHCFPVYE